MGFFKKLLGLGVAAGAAAAVVKVAEKVKENNPAGFAGADGKADPKTVVNEVVRAAGEFYHETADAVKEKAPEVVEKVKGFAGGFSAADGGAGEDSPAEDPEA